MAKATRADVDAIVSDLVRMTGLKLIVNDVPGQYGLRLIGAPAGPGAIHAGWLSAEFRTRDEFMIWLHGFAQGWTLCSG